MKTNFNSLLDQLDNGLSSKSFTFGIIIIIMSGVAMLSNLIVLIVINKFKKKECIFRCERYKKWCCRFGSTAF